MMFWYGLGIGCFVGALVGIFLVALLRASATSQEN